MHRTLTMTALILGILCSVPKSYASNKWENGGMIGTVATVLNDGLLLKNVYLQLPTTPVKQGASFYEYGNSKYTQTNETIFVYTDTTGFKANDLVAGSVRYRNMHAPDKTDKAAVKHEAVMPGDNKSISTKSKPSDKGDKVRAFEVVDTLNKLDSDKDIKGPVVVGDNTKADGKKNK